MTFQAVKVFSMPLIDRYIAAFSQFFSFLFEKYFEFKLIQNKYDTKVLMAHRA